MTKTNRNGKASVVVRDLDSPRNVMAADRWSYEYSCFSTHAFPTAVFAGNHCGNEDHVAATVATTTSALKQASFPFLHDLRPSRTDGQIHLRPRKKTSGINGHQPPIDGRRGTAAHKDKVLLKPTTMETNSGPLRRMMMQENERPWSSSPTRPKTAAIAIEKKKRLVVDTNDDDQPSLSIETMYDMATWRMYTRITDHRRKYPPKQPYSHHTPQPMPQDDEPSKEEERSANDAAEQNGYILDGEIFELEI